MLAATCGWKIKYFRSFVGVRDEGKLAAVVARLSCGTEFQPFLQWRDKAPSPSDAYIIFLASCKLVKEKGRSLYV